MAYVKSVVKINKGVLKKLTRAQITALEKTAEDILENVRQSQVIPRDTGTLQNEGTFVDYSKSAQGSCSIVSATPYARRLYYHPEYDFSKDENPNARGKWFEPWANGDKKERVRELYKIHYREEAGL